MESILIVLALSPVIFITALPSYLICLLPKIWAKKANIPSKLMASVSMILAIATGFYLNLELEGGLLSLPFLLIVLSSIWALVIVALFSLYSLIRYKAISIDQA